jgi:formylglycine-generating enzyme required for sulfatase activity
VTNEQFGAFVRDTGYTTVAERTSRELHDPFEQDEVALVSFSSGTGSTWRRPEGPRSDLRGRENHPVVFVADEDAEAYARWAGKRLPTEAEFEYAARGGLSGKAYPWGDELALEGKELPRNAVAAVAPVRTYRPNGFGLYDMAGNVWQWCSDWYRPDYYAQLARLKTIAWNPAGPDSSYDPTAPNEKKRVYRGGSFRCCEQLCSHYNVGARGKEEITSGRNDLGFRCVIDAAPKTFADGATISSSR